ncbi:MAG: hypothetical protein IIA00_06305 [Proteobacteria bacterium]|nr:hypothetical protein [Pseudomonadota bacterium]
MAREFDTALTLPPEYYPPIGEFMYRWAQLEYQMQEIIWRAVGIDNRVGRTLTVGMGVKTLTAILGTLTRRWLAHPTEKQMADSLAKGVRSLTLFRNHLAHGSWEYPKGGDPSDIYMIYMRETEQRILPTAKKHEPPEIQKNANELRRLNEKAQKLIHRLDARQTP